MPTPQLQLLFLDSFDHYDTNHMILKWTAASGLQINSTAGRNGQGVYITSNGGMSKTVGSRGAFSVGFAIKINTGGGIGATIYQLSALSNTGSLLQLASLELGADGTFILWAGTNNKVISNPKTFVYTAGVWMYVEVQFILNGGDPMNVTGSLSVNGQLLVNNASATGNVNTSGLLSQSALGNFHSFTGGAVVGTTYIDDLYIADATGCPVAGSGGGVTQGFYGDVKIGCIYPRADVVMNFTPSGGSTGYNLINERPPASPCPDEDATYIFDDNVGDNYNAAFDAVSSLIGQIPAVQFSIYARKDNEGSRALRWTAGLVSGTNLDDYWLGDNYHYHTIPLPGLWSATQINSTAFGVELIV